VHGITKTDAQNSLKNKVPAHASIFDQITKFGGYGSRWEAAYCNRKWQVIASQSGTLLH